MSFNVTQNSILEAVKLEVLLLLLSVMDFEYIFSVVVLVLFLVERTELHNRATRRNAGNSPSELPSNHVQHCRGNHNSSVRNYHIQYDSFVKNPGTL